MHTPVDSKFTKYFLHLGFLPILNMCYLKICTMLICTEHKVNNVINKVPRPFQEKIKLVQFALSLFQLQQTPHLPGIQTDTLYLEAFLQTIQIRKSCVYRERWKDTCSRYKSLNRKLCMVVYCSTQ